MNRAEEASVRHQSELVDVQSALESLSARRQAPLGRAEAQLLSGGLDVLRNRLRASSIVEQQSTFRRKCMKLPRAASTLREGFHEARVRCDAVQRLCERRREAWEYVAMGHEENELVDLVSAHRKLRQGRVTESF